MFLPPLSTPSQTDHVMGGSNLPRNRSYTDGSAGSFFGEDMRRLPSPPHRASVDSARGTSVPPREQNTQSLQSSMNSPQRVASRNVRPQTRPILPREQLTEPPQLSSNSPPYQRVTSENSMPQTRPILPREDYVESPQPPNHSSRKRYAAPDTMMRQRNPTFPSGARLGLYGNATPEALAEPGPILYPGSCARRLENLEHKSHQAKSELMRSISADISATFICIKQHIEAGTLSGDQTDVIEDATQAIYETDIRMRHSLKRDVRRLRKERNWSQRQYCKLAAQLDSLVNAYDTKVQGLTTTLQEMNGDVQHLREERDMLLASLQTRGSHVPQVNEDGGDGDEPGK